MIDSEMGAGTGPPKKRRWQFSLASLLVATAVFAFLLGLLLWDLVATFYVCIFLGGLVGAFSLRYLSGGTDFALVVGGPIGAGAVTTVMAVIALFSESLWNGRAASFARFLDYFLGFNALGLSAGLLVGLGCWLLAKLARRMP
jgi:hypothetical protein